jgi:hypothetical protein
MLLSDRLGMGSAVLHPGCQSHCLDSSICIRRGSKIGGTNTNVGGSLSITANWPQKLNITLRERAWRLVGVKVVDNPLTVLWKHMPTFGEKHSLMSDRKA